MISKDLAQNSMKDVGGSMVELGVPAQHLIDFQLHVIAYGKLSLFHDGQLKALDPATGAVSFSIRLTSPVSRFVSLAAAGGRLFVADGNKMMAINLR